MFVCSLFAVGFMLVGILLAVLGFHFPILRAFIRILSGLAGMSLAFLRSLFRGLFLLTIPQFLTGI